MPPKKDSRRNLSLSDRFSTMADAPVDPPAAAEAPAEEVEGAEESESEEEPAEVRCSPPRPAPKKTRAPFFFSI